MLRAKGNFNILAIKAPAFGQHRVELLEDICAITGAKLVDSHEQLTLDALGTVKRIVTDSDSSVITGETPDTRIEQLKAQLTGAKGFDEERLQNRISSLEGKIATIHVGGITETEVVEKVYRVDDAVHAAQAAQEEGIVPGGAISYLALETSDTPAGKLFKEALEGPFRQLMENAGLDADSKIKQVKDGKGFDVLNPEKPVDLIEAGIVDPAKVVRMAIQTSASIAASVITMGGLIADEEEKDET